MFTFSGIGRVGAAPKKYTANTAKGKKPVVSIPVYFDNVEMYKDRKKYKDIPGRVSIWDEKDHNWLMQYCKPGSLLKVTSSQFRLGTYTQPDGTEMVSLDMTSESVRFANFGTKDSGRNESNYQNSNSHSNTQKNESTTQDTVSTSENSASDDDPFNLDSEIEIDLIEQ